MEFLFVVALVIFATRRYKGGGVKSVRLNPDQHHEENVFRVLYDAVMKEGRIK